MRPWYVRIRPEVERTVGTFAAAGVGAALLGALGGLVLTGGGTGQYGDYVLAWAFGLVGVAAVAFFGTGLAALTGVRTARSVRGRAAYLAGSLGGFAGQVVMLGIVVAVVAPATDVRLSGALAVLALGSALPAAVAGVLGTAVGRHAGPPSGAGGSIPTDRTEGSGSADADRGSVSTDGAGEGDGGPGDERRYRRPGGDRE